MHREKKSTKKEAYFFKGIYSYMDGCSLTNECEMFAGKQQTGK